MSILTGLGIKRKSSEKNSRSFFLDQLEKSDSDLSKHYSEARNRDIDKKLNSVFGKDSDSVTQEELATFVDNFSQRLYLFKNSLPKSLTHILTGVLTHPNLSSKDKKVNFLTIILSLNNFIFLFSN